MIKGLFFWLSAGGSPGEDHTGVPAGASATFGLDMTEVRLQSHSACATKYVLIKAGCLSQDTDSCCRWMSWMHNKWKSCDDGDKQGCNSSVNPRYCYFQWCFAGETIYFLTTVSYAHVKYPVSHCYTLTYFTLLIFHESYLDYNTCQSLRTCAMAQFCSVLMMGTKVLSVFQCFSCVPHMI